MWAFGKPRSDRSLAEKRLENKQSSLCVLVWMRKRGIPFGCRLHFLYIHINAAERSSPDSGGHLAGVRGWKARLNSLILLCWFQNPREWCMWSSWRWRWIDARWIWIERILIIHSKTSHFHSSLKESQSSMTHCFDAKPAKEFCKAASPSHFHCHLLN